MPVNCCPTLLKLTTLATVASDVAAGGILGSLSNVGQQLTGIALHQQNGLQMHEVFESALQNMETGALSGLLSKINLLHQNLFQLQQSEHIGQSLQDAGVLNLAEQLLQIATHQQRGFSWQGFLITKASTATNSGLNHLNSRNAIRNFGIMQFRSVVNEGVSGGLDALLNHHRFDINAAVAYAFGTGLGSWAAQTAQHAFQAHKDQETRSLLQENEQNYFNAHFPDYSGQALQDTENHLFQGAAYDRANSNSKAPQKRAAPMPNTQGTHPDPTSVSPTTVSAIERAQHNGRVLANQGMFAPRPQQTTQTSQNTGLLDQFSHYLWSHQDNAFDRATVAAFSRMGHFFRSGAGQETVNMFNGAANLATQLPRTIQAGWNDMLYFGERGQFGQALNQGLGALANFGMFALAGPEGSEAATFLRSAPQFLFSRMGQRLGETAGTAADLYLHSFGVSMFDGGVGAESSRFLSSIERVPSNVVNKPF